MKERWSIVYYKALDQQELSRCNFCGAILFSSDRDIHWRSHELIIQSIIILMQTAGIDGTHLRMSFEFQELLSWVT